MAKACNFCSGTGNVGGGVNGKPCAKCKGSGKIAEPGDTVDVPAPTPSVTSRRGRSRSH